MLDSAVERLASLVDSDEVKEAVEAYLKVASRFHSYSFNNCLLILAQRPDATRVAGYHTWLSMGRQVQKGSKAIKILAPRTGKRTEVDEKTGEEVLRKWLYFVAVNVFDVADTDGDPLPGLDDQLHTSTRPDLLDALVRYATASGVKVEFRPLEGMGAPRGYSAGGKVVISSTMSDDDTLETLIHEVAHEMLHWTLKDDGSKALDKGLPRAIEEGEAEAVAFVVMDHFGMTNDGSAKYIRFWTKDGDVLRQRLTRITKVAHDVIKGIAQNLKGEAKEDRAA
jgi:antirestriction protein ArdC